MLLVHIHAGITPAGLLPTHVTQYSLVVRPKAKHIWLHLSMARHSPLQTRVPFSQQQATSPASLPGSSTHTCPPPSIHPTTTGSPRFASIHSTDSGYSSASASPSPKPHPLQLNTSLMNPGISRVASTSASTTLIDHSIPGSGSASQRSSKSTHTTPGFHCDRSLQVQDHTPHMSAAASSHAHSSLQDCTNLSSSRVRASPGQHMSSTGKAAPYPHRSPLMYPALLSRIAEALCSRITLSDIVKAGLTYKNAFNGHQAVNKIAYIIKTTDRNLMLLLGHALDAEKYFYAITYDHRLHNSPSDVYQFCMRIGSPFYLGELSPLPVTSPRSQDMSIPTPDAHTDAGSPSNEASNKLDPGKHQDATAVPGSDAAASRPRTFSAYCLQGHLHS